MVTKEVQL